MDTDLVRAAGVAGPLDAADQRDGRPAGRAHLRGPAPAAAHRGTTSRWSASPTRSAARTRATRAGSGRACPPCSAGPVSSGAPIRCSAPRSDGMTISTAGRPRSWTAGNALMAVGMNGQPLPIAHGFPARMVVPGLYGYTSATKWVTKLEVTTFAPPAGLLDPARLRAAGADQDRIADRRAAAARAGAGGPGRASAGVAWAPHRGISGGGGQRRQRPVAASRGWPPPTAPTPGGSGCGPGTPPPACTQLQVRATDGTGATQTKSRDRGVPQRCHRLGLGGGDRDLTAPPDATPFPVTGANQVNRNHISGSNHEQYRILAVSAVAAGLAFGARRLQQLAGSTSGLVRVARRRRRRRARRWPASSAPWRAPRDFHGGLGDDRLRLRLLLGAQHRRGQLQRDVERAGGDRRPPTRPSRPSSPQ